MRSSRSDESLITGLLTQGGADVEAFEQVFHKYFPMVRNFIKGMLKDAVRSDDVAQNIFMKLWINRHSLNRNLSLKNYLCVMARNEVINILSSKSFKSVHLQDRISDKHLLDYSTDELINYTETSARISKDIESMPPQRREIFKMSRYEHLSNMEIAIRMNLSVRTVEKHIELALKDLRKSIKLNEKTLYFLCDGCTDDGGSVL